MRAIISAHTEESGARLRAEFLRGVRDETRDVSPRIRRECRLAEILFRAAIVAITVCSLRLLYTTWIRRLSARRGTKRYRVVRISHRVFPTRRWAGMLERKTAPSRHTGCVDDVPSVLMCTFISHERGASRYILVIAVGAKHEPLLGEISPADVTPFTKEFPIGDKRIPRRVALENRVATLS